MLILQAYKELGLLMLLVGVAVLTFSSLVYFAEKDNPKVRLKNILSKRSFNQSNYNGLFCVHLIFGFIYFREAGLSLIHFGGD